MYGTKIDGRARSGLFGSTAGFTLVEVVTIVMILVAIFGLANWSSTIYRADLPLRGVTTDVAQNFEPDNK